MNDKDIFGKFYAPIKVLSYGRPYIFTVGCRSIGKSTGWAIWLLLEFLRHERQWIYTRRTQDELQETCIDWFSNAISILNNSGYKIELTYKGGEYKINGSPAGYAIPLSLEHKYKSANFSGVWYIVYDEFLSRDGRYLGGRGSGREVDCMSSLYQTVDRGIGRPFRDETTVVFIGNMSSYYNPFFINYGIDKLLRKKTRYLAPKGELYVVEQTVETEATKEIKNSYAYKLSRQQTKDYAYNNIAFDAGSNFIEKIKDPVEPLFNITIDGFTCGVYFCKKKGVLYVCEKIVDGIKHIAATSEDHKPNYLLVQRFTSSLYTKDFFDAYSQGLVRFENGRCKNAIDNYCLYMA